MSGVDLSASVLGQKWTVTAGVGSLAARASGGVEFVVEDTSGNIGYWNMDGNDTYTGGWKFSVLDLGQNPTPSTNSGTNPTLTAVRYIGMRWTATANVGGGDDNCYIDQILTWPNTGIVVTGDSTSFIDDLVDTLDNPAMGS